MLELEEAVETILVGIPPGIPETVAVAEADGRIITQVARAGIHLPIFDTSSMDGYAVRSADVASATKDNPVPLKVIGRIAAGERWSGVVVENTCFRLFTGSPLPEGADAVVMQEDTRPGANDRVEILECARAWENVRLQGEDLKKDSVIAEAGERLNAPLLMLLAATGYAKISVGRRPLVGLLATGSELIEPPASLAVGKIFESNRVGLAALVRAAGGLPKTYPIVGDTLTETKRALSVALAECDLVVTSGGVSVGEFDLIKPAIEELGGSLQFWKVAIKPGRPFVFGRAGGKMLFGLPGNPVSAFVTFLLLVRPAVLRSQGAKKMGLPGCGGILAESLGNLGKRRHFMRVTIDDGGNVRSAGTQASHIFNSLAHGDGLVDVPPDTNWPAGTRVTVLRWS